MTKPTTRTRPTLSRRALLMGLAVSAGCTRLGCPGEAAPGATQCHELESGLTFFSHVPDNLDRTAPLFVAVHGTGRDAEYYVGNFSGKAESAGLALMAPLFDEWRYSHYQVIERERGGNRADLALQTMVASLKTSLGITSQQILLYGHSGGAQFAHRYMMAHPEEVAALAVSAAGYYTWPDPSLDYPLGLRDPGRDGAPSFEPEKFLRVPAAVFVGSGDIIRDEDFYTGPRVDELQGRTRVERGKMWVDKMQAAARAGGHDTPYKYEVITGARHGLSTLLERGLTTRVFDWLLADRGNGAQKEG
jgi:pimeloyl-ACP methyl ester carboxylesterase